MRNGPAYIASPLTPFEGRSSPRVAEGAGPLVFELRTYEIEPGTIDDWLVLFHDKVVPLHAKHGLPVRGAWVDRDTSTFVWVREFTGEGTREEQEARYRASEDRTRIIGDEPKRVITSMSVRVVDSVFPVSGS